MEDKLHKYLGRSKNLRTSVNVDIEMSKISCFTVNKLMSAVSGHVRSSSANAGIGGDALNPSPSPKRRAKPPNRRERSRRPQEQRRQQDEEEEGDEWELAVNYGSPARSKSNVSLSPLLPLSFKRSRQSVPFQRRDLKEINAKEANFV